MDTDTREAPKMRELFVEELAEVRGGAGGDLCEKLGFGCATTMACCEEGPDGCCSPA